MSRLPAIQPQAATGKAKDLLDAVVAKLKITPNMTSVMVNSPAVLEAYLSFRHALGHVSLRSCERKSPSKSANKTPADTALAPGFGGSWSKSAAQDQRARA
jgi:hypothetical protein